MLEIITTKKFDKSLKRASKRGKDLSKLRTVIEVLVAEKELPQKYKDHKLTGNYIGTRECHIEPDWLLIYIIEGKQLKLVDTGTHSDLFK